MHIPAFTMSYWIRTQKIEQAMVEVYVRTADISPSVGTVTLVRINITDQMGERWIALMFASHANAMVPVSSLKVQFARRFVDLPFYIYIFLFVVVRGRRGSSFLHHLPMLAYGGFSFSFSHRTTRTLRRLLGNVIASYTLMVVNVTAAKTVITS